MQYPINFFPLFTDIQLVPTTQQDSSLPWYAIRIRSRAEISVAAILRGKGYEEFLPLYRSTRQWSDRQKTVELPLFPGYLFCRLDMNDRILPILSTPGVIAFAGAGRTPVAIPENEIAAIQSIVRSGLAALPWPSLTAGANVLIERGPLTGVEGVTVKVDGKQRLVVSVPLLQRSVMVEIDRRLIRPIGPPKSGPRDNAKLGEKRSASYAG